MKIRQHDERLAVLYSAILVLLFFGITYTMEFATDTYATVQEWDNWREKIFINGRIVTGAVYFLFEHFGIPGGICYHASQFSAMIFLTCAVTLLSRIYRRYAENNLLSVLLAFITIVNPFIIEFFLFIEKGLFMLAILLNVTALSIEEKMWREGFGIKPALGIFTCLIIAVFIYQTSVQIFVIGSLPLIILNKADFIKSNVCVALMYVICMGMSFCVVKWLFVSERLEGVMRPSFSDGFKPIKRIFLTDFFQMKRGVFLVWCIILLAVAVSVFLLIKTQEKRRFLLGFVYILAGTFFTSFVLYFIMAYMEIAPRTVYSFGMIIGVLLLFVFSFANEYKEKKAGRYIQYIAYGLIGMILIYNYISFGKVFVERYKCNQEERYYAEIIGEEISEYEEKTGEKIDTICFYDDYHVVWWGEGYSESNLHARAQACSWSRLTSINFYLDTDYVEGEQDPSYAEYFSGKDWNTYSREQLIFEGSTLHIGIY